MISLFWTPSRWGNLNVDTPRQTALKLSTVACSGALLTTAIFFLSANESLGRKGILDALSGDLCRQSNSKSFPDPRHKKNTLFNKVFVDVREISFFLNLLRDCFFSPFFKRPF